MTNPSEFQEENDNVKADDPNYFGNVLNARLTRRQTILGGFSAATSAMLGAAGISGCDNNGDEAVPVRVDVPATPLFKNVDKSLADKLIVPDDCNVSVLWALGDSFASADPAWKDDGSETAESYNRRAGDHHDGMYFFGLSAGNARDVNSNDRGVLAMNHEAINFFNNDGTNSVFVHPKGITTTGAHPALVRSVADEVRKEVNHHGCSFVTVAKTGSSWTVVKDAPLNRRVTAATTMNIEGPLDGDASMVTKFSTDGSQTRGTVNNCSIGHTPWGTFLTCEENWATYFFRALGDDALRTADEVTSLKRYGNSLAPAAVPPAGSLQRLRWNTASPEAGTFPGEFARWDTSVVGATAADDYRNVINTFGFVVEIDPYDTSKVPAKRTNLGRFAHEGCWPAKVTIGQPLVWYMGDDGRGEYIYKYVSNALWDAADATPADRMATGDKYLNSGKLYVAKFNADGTGNWLEVAAGGMWNPYLNTRLAADALGATKMDRPEWATVNPDNGEVYISLTNNSNRATSGSQTVDPANPRQYTYPTWQGTSSASSNNKGNINGHIIRMHEAVGPSSTSFLWDIFLFGAQADGDPATVNLSGLTAENDLSSPDGMWFSRPTNGGKGLLFIQTDDGNYTQQTNCMMLVAVPGVHGDGGPVTIGSVTTYKGKNLGPAKLRRFLVGPKQCEITGIDSTPDGKTLFVNIQHPGEESIPTWSPSPVPTSYGSNWPGVQFGASYGQRPRSATIVITRKDGGIVGL